MDKFIITKSSGNRITGPIMITTSPRSTCPTACPYRSMADGPEAGLCYAEHGHLGHYIGTGLDRTSPGHKISGRIPVHSLAALLDTIRALPSGTVWRHNQAGDLPSLDNRTIDRARLRQLTDANQGRRGFTYTHFDVIEDEQNQTAVREANGAGFTINLSVDTLDEADALADTGCGPVVVVIGAEERRNTITPARRKVVVCPARTHTGVTCATCHLCAVPTRKAIIAFPALGPAKARKRAHGQQAFNIAQVAAENISLSTQRFC